MSSILFIDKLKPSFDGSLIDEEDINFPYLSNAGKLIYWNGTSFVESSLTETDEKIISSKTLEVPPGSIDVGTGQELSGGRRLLNLKNYVSDEEFILHAIKILSTGTEPLHYPKMGALSDTTIQELKDTTSSLNFSFTYESTTNRYVNGYIMESPNNVVGGKITFRNLNASGDIISTIENISLTANTEVFVPLVNKLLYGIGDTTHVSIENMILKGTGVGVDFIPFFKSRSRTYSLENIITETNSANTLILAEKINNTTIRFTKRDNSTIDINVGDLVSTNNLSDLNDIPTARTNLNVDVAGTDNSTNVTLGGTAGDVTDDTLNLSGQELTVNAATQTTDGAMLANDKLKLDNISCNCAGDSWVSGLEVTENDPKNQTVDYTAGTYLINGILQTISTGGNYDLENGYGSVNHYTGLTSYQHRFVTLYVDADNVIKSIAGSPVEKKEVPPLPITPINSVPIALIEIKVDDSAVPKDIKNKEITDTRNAPAYNTDEFVRVSADDLGVGHLSDKLSNNGNVTFTIENAGGIETLKADASSNLNVFYAESLSLSTTDEKTYQTKVTLTDTFDAGDYFIEINYDWSLNSDGADFMSEVTLDGTRIGNEHIQEIKEKTRSQYVPVFRRYKRTLTGASHTIVLRYKTSNDDFYAEISSASITVTKIDIQ